MWLKVLAALAVIIAGAVWWHFDRADRQVTACNEMVSRFEQAYNSHRPASEVGPSDLRTVVARGRTFCAERNFDTAARLIRTSTMICRLNNGCKTT
ncbi:MAG: hypothetical protein KF794_14080 [Xanthobacteraceae bacterium]|nr:MAG: hypothetical protein KF794_14080 [Xanthobacteraceae bacterium]